MDQWILVEDEPDLYSILVSLYQLSNVNAIGFGDGESAVMWLNQLLQKTAQPVFDRSSLPKLALIDIRLPGKISGIDVARSIREFPGLSNIPVILMTAYYVSPQQESVIMAHSMADLLIMKPLPAMKELKKIFNDLLQNKR